jgi:hypothetical protein
VPPVACTLLELDVEVEPVKSVVVDAEAVLVGPAVTVTGISVISLWAKWPVDVPGKLAPVPLIISVQTAVVVPPIEQTMRPQLSVIVSLSSQKTFLGEKGQRGDHGQSIRRVTHCPFHGLRA